jgi:hypothetical protein
MSRHFVIVPLKRKVLKSSSYNFHAHEMQVVGIKFISWFKNANLFLISKKYKSVRWNAFFKSVLNSLIMH